MHDVSWRNESTGIICNNISQMLHGAVSIPYHLATLRKCRSAYKNLMFRCMWLGLFLSVLNILWFIMKVSARAGKSDCMLDAHLMDVHFFVSSVLVCTSNGDLVHFTDGSTLQMYWFLFSLPSACTYYGAFFFHVSWLCTNQPCVHVNTCAS